MLLSEGYQGLVLHFDYKDRAPTMTHVEVPRENRAATSVRSQGAIRGGALQ